MWVVVSGVGDGKRQHDSRSLGARASASADLWMEIIIWEELARQHGAHQHGVDLLVNSFSPQC